MLILLSPTRTMDMSTPVPTDCPPATIPHFLNEAKQIAEEADRLSREVCPVLLQHVIHS